MKLTKFLIAAALGLGLGLGQAAPVLAQADSETITVGTVGEVRYANGGFGLDEREAMNRVAGEYNLHLMFSQTPRSAFVADVALQVADRKGTTVFELAKAGPLTYVQLPAGRYRLTATYEGQAQTRTVSLSAKRVQVVNFQWQGPAEPEPSP